jgi:small subunit ribosomal protein S17
MEQNSAAPAAHRHLKTVIGVVTSDKMQKTRVVSVTTMTKHPFFGKFVKSTLKFHVHDEKELSHTGDKVQIIQSRPLSKTKHWRLQKVIEQAV